MNFWIVKHKSGNILPNMKGSSFWEPEKDGGTPRLFKSRAVARSWLSNYCKGPIEVDYHEEDDGWGPVRITFTKRDTTQSRNPSDFSIHEARLEII